MSRLHFLRDHNQLVLVDRANNAVKAFPAANNVDSHAKGPWPDGMFRFVEHKTHPDDAPDSAYGSHGILIFDVPGREGMGVHSGRAEIEDELGRAGYRHCTMGCIRTDDAAMAEIVAHIAGDPLESITVGETT